MAEKKKKTPRRRAKAKDSPYLLQKLDAGVELWAVPIEELVEQDQNARVMDGAVFERLQTNIGERGALVESLPYCHLGENGEIRIISGHHRVRAARAARGKRVHCLVDTNPMSRSEVVAKQLAHNALNGSDDEEMLRVLVSQMTSIEDILESFVGADDSGMKALSELSITPPAQMVFEFMSIAFVFLPSQVDDLEALVASIEAADLLGVADLDQYESFKVALAELQRVTNVRSIGTAVALMVRAAHLLVADHEAILASEEAAT